MGIANVPESGSRSGSKQSLINFSIVTRLMALIVASLFSVFCMGLFSSCSSDEDDELKVETQLLISLKEGSTGIDGIVYVFPDGLYDPTTFKASTLGTIETLGGKKVTGIGTGSYYKNGGYCKFECEPGKYYVVGVYLGKSSWGGIPHQTWKGVNATATKNRGTIVDIQLSTFSFGCQN